MFLASFLKDLGFNQNEIYTYNALFNLKNFNKASDIAKAANINRTTCYLILENMYKNGLCNIKMKNSVKYFAVNNSIKENLYNYIQKQKVKIQENEKKLNKLLPFIEKHETFISHYNGLEELKDMYLDSLNAKNQIISFINPNNIDKSLAKFLIQNIFQKRHEQNIKSYCISNELFKNKKENILNYFDKKIFIPYQIFPFNGDISIYENKILLSSWSDNELLGIIIQSKNLSSMMKSIFHLCSQIAEEYDAFLNSIK